eukprot:3956299-Pleurochrysis_carterae.AAC.1
MSFCTRRARAGGARRTQPFWIDAPRGAHAALALGGDVAARGARKRLARAPRRALTQRTRTWHCAAGRSINHRVAAAAAAAGHVTAAAPSAAGTGRGG